MSVDRNEVERIAELAHLNYEGATAERLADEMSRILDYAAHLRGGDESTVGPESGEVPNASPAVSDESPAAGLSGARAPGADRPDTLAVTPDAYAPRFEQDFFAVPPPPGVTPGDVSEEPDPDPRTGTVGED
jgi:hypothetical protein